MRIPLIIFMFFNTLVSLGGTIVIEGHYQKQNIYIKNDFSNLGVGYCTYEVRINGKVSTDEIYSTSFEIDLAQYQLELGAPVSVTIRYKDDGCMPLVLNPNALTPNPTFETLSIDVNNKGMLEWKTANETASLPFIVEQFKWNKWVQIGEVQGVGTPEKHAYQFQTTPHSGINKFRIKQKGFIDKTIHSPSVSYKSLKPEITYVYNKKKQILEFAEHTSYEVYNKYGELVKKGFDVTFSTDNLQKGVYYMNYGNSTTEFTKK